MEARLLSPNSSLLVLLGDIRYTQARLKADPLTTTFVVIFGSLRDEWNVVQAQEIEFQEQLADAQAALDTADVNLDAFASRFSKAVLTLVNDDRSSHLYILFFGNKPLSLFIRPKLGIELVAMKEWPKKIEESSYPTLKAMLPELLPLLDAAEKSITRRNDVKSAIRTFHDVGARRKLFDKTNGARKSTYGALAKLALETMGLPSDYAAGFFRADPVRAAAEPTLESLTDDIKVLSGKLAAKNVALANLQQAAVDAKKASEQKTVDTQQIASIQKQIDDLEKAKTELADKLKKP
jgi:hypothetical protein